MDSKLYREFCTKFNIKIKTISPYHACSNGQAERAVQIAKRGLEKMLLESKDKDIIENLYTFLLAYQSTPTTSTGKTPIELLCSFKPRTLLSMLNPLVVKPSEKSTLFREGDEVKVRYSKNLGTHDARVIRPISDTMYLVSIAGVIKKAHQNQMYLAHPIVRSNN